MREFAHHCCPAAGLLASLRLGLIGKGQQAETLYRWLHGGYTKPRNDKAQRVKLG